MLTKYNVSEIGFYLRPQVKPTQLGPIDRASPSVQEYNICTNLPSSQTRRSSIKMLFFTKDKKIFTKISGMGKALEERERERRNIMKIKKID
jgi:hypothetical protein